MGGMDSSPMQAHTQDSKLKVLHSSPPKRPVHKGEDLEPGKHHLTSATIFVIAHKSQTLSLQLIQPSGNLQVCVTPCKTMLLVQSFLLIIKGFFLATTKIREPRYYQEAVTDAKWRHAMHEEITALENNGTWKIVDLPSNKKPISCKWVYRVKYNSNGYVQRYKA